MQFYVGRNINTNCSFFGGTESTADLILCTYTGVRKEREMESLFSTSL